MIGMSFRSLRSFAPALGLFLIAGLLGGCNPPTTIVGGKSAPKHYNSVVSLAPGASEIAASNAVQLVGRTESCDFPVTVKAAPVVMKGIHPDFEKIKQINPSLVMYDKDLTGKADLDKFAELKIDTFGFGATTVDEFVKEIYRFGAMIGKETFINDSLQNVFKAKDKAAADPINPKPKVAILMPVPNGNPMIAGTGSFYADLVRCAGGEPIGPNDSKFVNIGFEQLTQLNPDCIIVGASKGDYSALTNSPTLSQLRAVKTAKYFGIDEELLFRRGNRVATAIEKLHLGLKGLFNS